jgi:hypothetical protein
VTHAPELGVAPLESVLDRERGELAEVAAEGVVERGRGGGEAAVSAAERLGDDLVADPEVDEVVRGHLELLGGRALGLGRFPGAAGPCGACEPAGGALTGGGDGATWAGGGVAAGGGTGTPVSPDVGGGVVTVSGAGSCARTGAEVSAPTRQIRTARV